VAIVFQKVAFYSQSYISLGSGAFFWKKSKRAHLFQGLLGSSVDGLS
jgi:hypothetical protein